MINKITNISGIDYKPTNDELALISILQSTNYSIFEVPDNINSNSNSNSTSTTLTSGDRNLQTNFINISTDPENLTKNIEVSLINKRFTKQSVINSLDVNFKELKIPVKNNELERLGLVVDNLETNKKVIENELDLLKKSNIEKEKQLEEAKKIIENLSKTPDNNPGSI
jgi:hypothetical protein